jgi:hypothetical protein
MHVSPQGWPVVQTLQQFDGFWHESHPARAVTNRASMMRFIADMLLRAREWAVPVVLRSIVETNVEPVDAEPGGTDPHRIRLRGSPLRDGLPDRGP